MPVLTERQAGALTRLARPLPPGLRPPLMPDPAISRRHRCRYLRQRRPGELERCTAEVADEGGEIALCPYHLGRAMELLRRVGALPPADTPVPD